MNFLMTEFDILVRWMQERQSIRDKRARGLPRPWTLEPLLRDYRWCNVRRMDDRVSRELFAQWYGRGGKDVRTEFTAAALARLINWMPTLLFVTDNKPFALNHLSDAAPRLRHYASKTDKVFTAAYIVPGEPGKSKTDSVMATAHQVSAQAEDLYTDSMRGTWLNFTALPRVGGFLAGQMVADLAHLHSGHEWADRDTWAPVGPGSARGLNRLLGRDKDKPVSQPQFEDALPVLRRELGVWIDLEGWKLQAMDLQGCLCEFDKYRRLQLGEGTVRARYQGSAPSTTGSLLT